MPSPSGEETSAASTIPYDSPSFTQLVQNIADRARERTGLHLVFAGGTRMERQQALSVLSQHTASNVHQFALSSLLNVRRMQTQNSIRKAFDAAAEERAFIYINRADAIFDWVHADADEYDGEAEPSAMEYLFQRIEAYPGPVIVCLSEPQHVDQAQTLGIDLVVQFDEGGSRARS